jgi:hypothetical protein
MSYLRGHLLHICEGVQLGQVAIYCGVSTDAQSCERQERDLRAFARRAGHRVVGVFKETASGAKNDRVERKKVVALAQAREIASSVPMPRSFRRFNLRRAQSSARRSTTAVPRKPTKPNLRYVPISAVSRCSKKRCVMRSLNHFVDAGRSVGFTVKPTIHAAPP